MPQFRARLEYLYYGFNNGATGSAPWIAVPGGGLIPCFNAGICASPFTYGNTNVQTLRVGISYAFGGGAARSY
jgi:hypothetical protein